MTIRTTLIAALLAAAALCAPTLAFAAGTSDDAIQGPTGVAIVAGPEVGFGMCFATTPEEGFACARTKCEAGAGEVASECMPVRWCVPARFGAAISINNSEGFTYQEYLCNENDEAALGEAVRDICQEAYAQSANGCQVGAAWDLDGKELTLPEEVSAPAQ